MYNIINICLVCVCNSIIIMTENEVELSYGRAIYERIDLLDLLDDDLSDIYIITGHRQSLRKCACTCVSHWHSLRKKRGLHSWRSISSQT